MGSYLLYRYCKKYFLVILAVIVFSGGAGVDMAANILKENGDIADYTILMEVYSHKEAIKEVLSKVSIEDIIKGVTTVKETTQKIKEKSHEIDNTLKSLKG